LQFGEPYWLGEQVKLCVIAIYAHDFKRGKFFAMSRTVRPINAIAYRIARLDWATRRYANVSQRFHAYF
jgi:hypothetical protein